MRIAILMGNPDKEGTLSNELADSYEAAAKEAGHEVRRTNVGDLRFDPLLHKGYKVIQQLAMTFFSWRSYWKERRQLKALRPVKDE